MKSKTCPMCHGKGKMPDPTAMVRGRMKTCPKCGGKGEMEGSKEDKAEGYEEES